MRFSAQFTAARKTTEIRVTSAGTGQGWGPVTGGGGGPHAHQYVTQYMRAHHIDLGATARKKQIAWLPLCAAPGSETAVLIRSDDTVRAARATRSDGAATGQRTMHA